MHVFWKHFHSNSALLFFGVQVLFDLWVLVRVPPVRTLLGRDYTRYTVREPSIYDCLEPLFSVFKFFLLTLLVLGEDNVLHLLFLLFGSSYFGVYYISGIIVDLGFLRFPNSKLRYFVRATSQQGIAHDIMVLLV